MKIGFDLRVLTTGKLSGIEEYTLLLSRHLLRCDKENEYRFYYNSFRTPLHDSFKGEKVVLTRFPNRLLDMWLQILKNPALDKLTAADVFFSPHFLVTPLSSAPRILTVHDLSFLRFPEFFSLRQRSWFLRIRAGEQIKSADRIVVPSLSTKQDVMRFLQVPEGKITVIHHGINPIFSDDYSEQSLLEFRKRKNLPEQFILYLGTVEPRKNIPHLMKAAELLFPQFPDLHLVIAGSLGWLFDEVMKSAAESAFKSRIIFLHHLPAEERPKLYRLATLFAYPSFFEGFGFPPLEAQLSRVPVVASNRSSLPEILGDSAILVDPYRISDLAEAMRCILLNRGLRENLIRMGYKNAVQFKWSNAVKDYMHLFNSLQEK